MDRRFLIFVAVIVAAAVIVAIVLSMQSPPPPGNGGGDPYTVDMKGLAYSPRTLTVPVGTTVNWTNSDGTTHTVTFDNEIIADSGNIPDGGRYSVTFDQPGTYNYHCTIHPGMTGQIIVQ